MKEVVVVDKEFPNNNFEGDDLIVGHPDGSDEPGTEKRVLINFNLDYFDDG